MRHYEDRFFIVHPDQRRAGARHVERYKGLIGRPRQGTVHRLEDWGRRQAHISHRQGAQGALRGS